MSSEVIVEVDELQVIVDKASWEKDPEKVSNEVRAARREQGLTTGEEQYQDYDQQGGDVDDEGVPDEDEEDLDEEADF